MQLMVALLIVGGIIGALAQQVLVARIISRKPATCEAAVLGALLWPFWGPRGISGSLLEHFWSPLGPRVDPF